MKALVLAGGFPQIALIQELQRRGYYVILADWSEDPVAKQYCNKYYKTSTLDTKAIKDIAISENVDFLITVCTDQALLTVAKVSEELGLPCYLDYNTGLNVTNKQYMKKIFKENKIPSTKYIVDDNIGEEKLKGFRYPLITKPADCNSSKGVIKVNNYKELVVAFENARELSRTNTVIVEEFVEGKELTIDAYVCDGIVHVMAISESEKIKDNEKFVIFRSLNPARISADTEANVSKIVQQIADSFDLKNTPLLVQMIIDDNCAYVIEFSARTGGGIKHLTIKELTGIDVIKMVVDLTEGKRIDCNYEERKNALMVNEYIYCYPGVFERIDGLNELKESGIISDYYIFKKSGAVFDSISNSGDRVAGFTIVGDTPDELKKKHSLVNESFKVLNDLGQDMARHDLLVEVIY